MVASVFGLTYTNGTFVWINSFSHHWWLPPPLSNDYNNALKIVSFFEAMNILTKITEPDMCALMCAKFISSDTR